jgi:hypothetical protein
LKDISFKLDVLGINATSDGVPYEDEPVPDTQRPPNMAAPTPPTNTSEAAVTPIFLLFHKDGDAVISHALENLFLLFSSIFSPYFCFYNHIHLSEYHYYIHEKNTFFMRKNHFLPHIKKYLF